MRCIALAEEFAGRGHEVSFVADVESVPFVRDQLADRGFAAVPPPEDVPGHVALLRELAPEAVVLDGYVLPLELYEAVAAIHPTLALVDGDPQGRTAHLYLDQNLGAEEDVWPLPAGAQRLAGLDYVLLRDDVLRLRPTAPRSGGQADPLTVLAVFGGTDAFGAAPVAVRALAATGQPFALTVIAGNDAVRAELDGVDLGADQQMLVIGPSTRLAELVAEADLVVSASGTSSWELLCLGTACAMVCVADNQLVSYGRMVETGAVHGIGLLEDLRTDDTDAVAVLSMLLQDAVERDRLRAAGWLLVDGRGKTRVADAVLRLPGLV